MLLYCGRGGSLTLDAAHHDALDIILLQERVYAHDGQGGQEDLRGLDGLFADLLHAHELFGGHEGFHVVLGLHELGGQVRLQGQRG